MKTTLIIITLMLYSYEASCEIYKWVDELGKSHFTDTPPKDQKVEEVKLKINTYTSVQVAPSVDRLGKQGKVVMYSASWCGVCKQAKAYFRKNNIPHIIYDVEKSLIGKRDFKTLGGKSVPVIILGKTRINGFTAPRFARAYKQYMDIEPEPKKPGFFEDFFKS